MRGRPDNINFIMIQGFCLYSYQNVYNVSDNWLLYNIIGCYQQEKCNLTSQFPWSNYGWTLQDSPWGLIVFYIISYFDGRIITVFDNMSIMRVIVLPFIVLSNCILIIHHFINIYHFGWKLFLFTDHEVIRYDPQFVQDILFQHAVVRARNIWWGSW